MRGTGDKLEDKYIVPIARELAIALKAIHDGGIIHRDIKGRVALSKTLPRDDSFCGYNRGLKELTAK